MADQAVSEREQKVLGLIENVRGRRAKFRDAQITMAHGAGGKATQTLIEGLFVPSFGGETLARWPTPARSRSTAWRSRSRPTPTSSSRCGSRAARSASWRSTAR